MYRRDVCTGEKLVTGECKDAKSEILKERLLLRVKGMHILRCTAKAYAFGGIGFIRMKSDVKNY